MKLKGIIKKIGGKLFVEYHKDLFDGIFLYPNYLKETLPLHPNQTVDVDKEVTFIVERNVLDNIIDCDVAKIINDDIK